jgi:hypothetical protein
VVFQAPIGCCLRGYRGRGGGGEPLLGATARGVRRVRHVGLPIGYRGGKLVLLPHEMVYLFSQRVELSRRTMRSEKLY